MKTVLITGASGGIGSATAVLFSQKGYRVILNYHKSEQSAKILCESLNAGGGECVALEADVSDSARVDDMFRTVECRFGGVDILVNNAGISSQRLFTDISDDEWNRMIAVNLSGTFYCCRAALPYMLKKKSGSIVNVASVWGQTGGSCEVHYSAAKSGVIGLTKALAKEVGPSNIRVNCVAPGVISTRMNSNLSIGDLSDISEQTPLGRIGETPEVAGAIYFLASGESEFITGQVLAPNGGLYI